MKNIGMLVAVEIDSVLRRYGRPAQKRSLGGFEVLSYESEAYCLHVLNSGAGEIAAAAGTQLLISVFDVELIVNFGLVGGLTAEMEESRSCVVEKIVHYDFDASAWTGVQPGQYMMYPDIYIPASSGLIEKAEALHPELRRVICASGDKFVSEPGQKRRLHELYGADICEMEAAGIALTCNRNGVPFLMIKTVSDGLEGGSEAFIREFEQASNTCLEITDRIIRTL